MGKHIKSKELGDDYLNIVQSFTENQDKEESPSYKPGVKHMEISF